MILCDTSIARKIKTGEITISPFRKSQLQPASYDLTLDNEFLLFDKNQEVCIDVRKPVKNNMKRIKIKKDEPFILHPGEFALANVYEITGVNDKHVGWLMGKSSLGRLGLIIHATAGFLDPGNKLRLTLELSNVGSLPIKLYYEMKIAQIAFGEMDDVCKRPYGSKELNSKYFGDKKVKESQMYRNFK
ncbi:MAG: dCTP deaminase [bacterium]